MANDQFTHHADKRRLNRIGQAGTLATARFFHSQGQQFRLLADDYLPRPAQLAGEFPYIIHLIHIFTIILW